MKHTYTPAIQAELAEIEPMLCKPSPNAAILASIAYSLAKQFQSDLGKKYATNGGDWSVLRDRNLAKAKFYWEQL